MSPSDPIFDWMRNPLNEKTLLLIRGVPASGKSFRALELSSNNPEIIFSADKFFGSTKEEYIKNWCVEKLYPAHKWCKDNARNAMQLQLPLVIIDNTNIKISEIIPYFSYALKYGYKFQIEEPKSPWWLEIVQYLNNKQKNKEKIEESAKLLFEKNQHGVPYEAILKMLNKYQVNITFEQLVNHACKHWKDEDDQKSI